MFFGIFIFEQFAGDVNRIPMSAGVGAFAAPTGQVWKSAAHSTTKKLFARHNIVNNRDYIRWCFADAVAAKEFAEAFADMIA
jgi:uncharacterized protein CbrC (UPF0167 family)